MKKAAMAFSGPSNSGKTTLILKVAKKFIDDGLKVVIIKHDPGDKARFDVEGKDSYKFSQIGAEVAVMSPTRTTFFSQESKSVEDVDYLSFSNAIASYKKDYEIDKPNFDLDDTQAICEWILKNAKVLK